VKTIVPFGFHEIQEISWLTKQVLASEERHWSTGYCYGVVSYTAPRATATNFRPIVLPVWVLIIPDSSTRVHCSGWSRHLVAKRGETGREMSAEFCVSVSLGSLTCRNILRHGADGFTSPPKEELRIFNALKNSLLSNGFEPTNLRSSWMHDNHYITDGLMDPGPAVSYKISDI
jgi:hypothetical protein